MYSSYIHSIFDVLKSSRPLEWDPSRFSRTSQPVVKEKRYLVPVDQRSTAKPKKIVQTLERAHLSKSDHLELSHLGRFVIQCDPNNDSPKLRARLTMHPKDDQPPFPEHTHGFLYFVPAPHPAVQLASQVRFRITRDDDPNSFDEGKDLLNPDYTPWNIPLVSIARIPRFGGLRHLLLSHALVPPLVLETAGGLDVRIGPPAKIIHSLGQLFSLQFTVLKPIFCFASATTMHQKALRIFEDWRGEGTRKALYSGKSTYAGVVTESELMKSIQDRPCVALNGQLCPRTKALARWSCG